MSDENRRKQNSSYAGDIDPDVAELIGIEDTGGEDVPDFGDLFDEPGYEADTSETEPPDFSVKGFNVPEEFEEQPKPFFNDKHFYKKVLTGEGDISNRLHGILSSFLNAKDSQDRSLYRGKIIPAYWELAGHVAGSIGQELPVPKIVMLRFAVLLPTLLSAEQRQMISKIIWENKTGEPFYYVDEWLKEVARGRVNPSAVDETKTTGKNEAQKVNAIMEKTRGRHQAQLSLVKNRAQELQEQEELLQEKVRLLVDHERLEQHGGLISPYNDTQRSAFSEISAVLRRLSNLDKDLARQYRELDGMEEQLEGLKEKEAELGDATVDRKTVVNELNTVRQMAKMCVGRQGNHYPVLMKQYLRGTLMDVGTRENVIKIMAEVERLDPGIFLRTFKMETNRIVPNVVLVPCYGDSGICWEPFERFSRATSRGRLAVPMYPKDLKAAVISSLADLRWQVAKEKAQHYWMEEGLTGWYYQWFTDNRMKGDVKDAFVQDYILWITKESEGTQKLDREIRGIFWRYIPFPQETKDQLRNRGFVYSELYKKDQNRSMSDGY